MTDLDIDFEKINLKPKLKNLVLDYVIKKEKIKIIINFFKKSIVKEKNKYPNMPYLLVQIKKFLKNESINIANNKDGRNGSNLDEQTIINKIIKNSNYEKICEEMPPRHWFDFKFFYNGKWHPCNIKTSTFKSADNVGGLALLLYALTNCNINIDNKMDNRKASTLLLKNIEEKEFNNLNRDYFFLVVSKEDSKDIIIQSILNLETYKINLNNLPFQVKWNNNRSFKYQTPEEFTKKWIQNYREKSDENPHWLVEFNNKICDMY